jgi:(p)ppGpp synthase/HD superfamily hydrolase
MSSSATVESQGRQSLTTTPERLPRFAYRPEIKGAAESLQAKVFPLCHPLEYYRIARAIGPQREQAHAIRRVVAWLEAKLAEHGIRAQISGRLKSIPSIYRKMQRRDMPLDSVYDIRGVRIIVEDQAACYQVLELVHQSLEPIPGQLDDYVRQPKSNGYQSLHTVVLDREGKSFEVQIRTPAMHRVAELGTAAHWRYKGHDDLSQGAPKGGTASPSRVSAALPARAGLKKSG